MYLQCRACDIARYGEKVAELTFPQPTIEGATTKQVADLVASLVTLLQESTQREEKQEVEELLTRLERGAQGDFKRISNRIIPMPDIHLCDLTNNGIEALKDACLKELSQSEQGGWNAQVMLAEIKYYVKIFTLLKQPENHIQVPSMQYVEKQVNTRTIKDMQDEMAQELIDLPPKIAYAKLIQEKGEERLVIKRKFKTLQPPKVLITEFSSKAVQDRIEQNTLAARMVKKRSEIEEEIRERQGKWRRQIPDSKRQLPPSEEPPPTFY
jgi:hypothetical protein